MATSKLMEAAAEILSGSMSDHMENTVKQLINLVMFCKKVNIPYEVYAFTSEHEASLV